MKNTKLIELGFEEKVRKDDDEAECRITEYRKDGICLTLYDYWYPRHLTSKFQERKRKQYFVVYMNRCTHHSQPIDELDNWLKKNSIK